MDFGRSRFCISSEDENGIKIEDGCHDLDCASHTSLSPLSARSDGCQQKETFQKMKRKLSKIKGELEVEKMRNKQMKFENLQELKSLRLKYKNDLKEQKARLKEEKCNELDQILEDARKEIDDGLRQVLKYKDEELKHLKKQFLQEKDDAIRIAFESQRINLVKELEMAHSEEIDKFKEEVYMLREVNATLEKQYNEMCKLDKSKEEKLSKIKQEFDAELQKVLKGNKLFALRDLQKLKCVEMALNQKDGIKIPENTDSVSPEMTMLHPINSVERCDEAVKSGTLLNKGFLEGEKKPLQRKVSDLHSQIQRLERKVMILKTENDTLIKKQEDKKCLEEKIKGLKRRNIELAGIARRLEEKAKHLQQQNLKRNKEESIHDNERYKKLYLRHKTKDLAEHRKDLLSKDKEIDQLQQKCQALLERLAQSELFQPQNAAELYGEKEELELIMKQAAKERLLLERQVSRTLPGMETELQKSAEVENRLTNEIEELQRRLHDLEQMARSNPQRDGGTLGMMTEGFEDVNKECSSLKLNLNEAQQDCEVARGQVVALETKVNSLGTVVKELKVTEEIYQRLENEHQETLEQLKLKEEEVKMLHKANDGTRKEHEQLVETLKEKLSDLELKSQLQELKQEELNFELQLLREQAKESGFDPVAFLSQAPVDLAATSTYSHGQKFIHQDTKNEETLRKQVFRTEFSQHMKGSLDSTRNSDIDKCSKMSHDSGMESGQELKNENLRLTTATETQLPALLARKGPLQVFIAKYNYDPYQYSPNENPEAELPLNSGDYVLVYGDMDEDGFFYGESIDGKRGLVPSNFVEKVADEDLVDFPAILAASGHHSDDSIHSNSIQHELEFNSSDESDKVTSELKDLQKNVTGQGVLDEMHEDQASRPLTDLSGYLSPDDSEDVIQFPYQLNLDRQLSTSLLISWKHPQGLKAGDIKSYHVFVDHVFKTSIKGTERTKALLEDVDSKKVHRVSVQAVTPKGHSKHAQCIMLVGKDIVPAPSEVTSSNITANSALISWLPGNSNNQHVILVNGHEVSVVNPGVFKHKLTGLAPATCQKVTVRARSLTAGSEAERNKKKMDQLSASIEFETMAAGLPDPPLDVQVEAGPQEGTILLTWLPVTIDAMGMSTGAVILGYIMYADGKQLKVVQGATTDHVLLNYNDFPGIVPKLMTVRTMTVDKKESRDSQAVKLPANLIKEIKTRTAKSIAYEAMTTKDKIMHESFESTAQEYANDTDEEIEAAFRDCVGQDAKKGPIVNPHFGKELAHSSGSELSDIAEVEEENMSEGGAQEAPTESQVAAASYGAKLHDQTSSHEKSPGKASNRLEVIKPEPALSSAPRSPDRVVPAIEITRDSSTERGNSIELSEDEAGRRHKSPSEIGISAQKHRYIHSKRKSDAGKEQDAFRDRYNPTSGDTKMGGNIAGIRSGDISGQQLASNDLDTKQEMNNVYYGNMSLVKLQQNGIDNKMRLFVALFDYDPATMSPNADGFDVELPFREGQIIKVFGDKDPDGFYRGECNGKNGYVPCNMITEIQVDDPDLAEQLLKDSQNLAATPKQRPRENENYPAKGYSENSSPNGLSSLSSAKRMISMYDYDPQELSPNVDSEVELAFKVGDIIMIYGDMDDDGFYLGEINGVRGLVPSNFLREAPLSDEELESASVVSPVRSRESLIGSPRYIDEDGNQLNSLRGTPPPEQKEDSPISTSAQISTLHSFTVEDDRKGKRKGGILSKGKNILKKFAR